MLFLPVTLSTILICSSYVSASEGEDALWKFPLPRNYNLETEPFGIINGTKTDILHHPYQAKVLLQSSRFSSSGVIVNKRWILALPYLPSALKYLQVSVGQSKSTEIGTLYDLEKIILHPNFTGGTENYVSLLKLKRPLKLTKKVKTIPIASTSPKSGSKATVSGWGVADKNYTISENLMEATLSVLTREECKPKYIASFVSPTTFCATKQFVKPTAGDSGDPLVQNNKLIGVFLLDLSVASLCTTYPDCPSIFTDVTKLKSWITETIKNE